MAGDAIRYCRASDGTRIAYTVIGDGEPLVFASNVLGDAHFRRMGWPFWRDEIDWLVAAGWQVILYDVRGMGASERDVADLTLDARVRDLDAVVRAVGLGRFALAGVDLGAPVAVAFAVVHPDAVSRLVLHTPWASGADMFALPELQRATRSVPTESHEWELYTNVLATIVTGFDDAAMRMLLVDIIKQGVSPAGLAAYYESSEAIDVTDLLKHVQTPTLVVHEPTFPFGSFELCSDVAALVDEAELVIVGGPSLAGTRTGSHAPVIDRFLRGEATTIGASGRSAEHRPDGLTAREVEVLALVAGGLSNKEIASALGVAVPTVERHLVNAYAKIGARGRADATAYALRQGLASTHV